MGKILVFSENGTYITKTTLESARTDSYAGNKTVVVTSALTQAQSNITGSWPTDRVLKVEKGGSIANSTSFTINGTFEAGLYRVFTGAGVVTFGSGAVPEVFPEWWGVASSSTLQSAVNSIQSGTVNATNMGSWTATSGVAIKRPLKVLFGAGTISSPASATVMFDIGFDGSGSANNAEFVGSAGTVIKLMGDGSAAIKNNECRWTQIRNIAVDMNNKANSYGLFVYGGWYLNVSDINIVYGSVAATSYALYIDSHTNGVAGITGSYGGAYVNTFTNFQGRNLVAVGHDTSTVTTTTFTNCDFQIMDLTLCRILTFIQPVIQPLAADTIAIRFTNSSSISFIGGDFEFSASITMYKFYGSCRGIQSINNSVGALGAYTITYISEDAPGALNAGNYFMDDTWSGTLVNHVRGYFGSSQDLQFANSGYINKHHLGTQYSGDTLVLSHNLKLLSDTTGVLDDPAKNGYVLYMNASGQLAMKFAAAAAGTVSLVQQALFDAVGMTTTVVKATALQVFADNTAAAALATGTFYRASGTGAAPIGTVLVKY